MRLNWRLAHYTLFAGNCLLFVVGALPPEGAWLAPGGAFHFVARCHPWLTQVSLGLVSVSLLWPFLRAPGSRQLAIAALLSLDLTFFTGLLGPAIENYPNENIQIHKLWAAVAYGLSSLMLVYLLGSTQIRQKQWLRALSFAALLPLLVAAGWGGVVHKGIGYLLAGGTLRDFVANGHHIAVHFVLAAVILALILRNQSKKISAPLRVGAAIFVVSLLSGALLAFRLGVWSPMNLSHFFLGILTPLSLLFLLRKPRKGSFRPSPWIPVVLTLLAITSGILVEFGPGYFRPSTRWSAQEARNSGIRVDDRLKKFKHSVQPVLERKCVSCHDGSNSNTQLRLDSFASLLGGGRFYNLIEGGAVEKSDLYRRLIVRLNSDDHMPLFEGMLSSAEISGVRDWIDQGGFTFDNVPARAPASSRLASSDHWSLRRFTRPSVPPLPIEDGNSIDAFVFAKLAKTDFRLRQKPPGQLIRDAFMDSTGLVPTASEARRFLEGKVIYEEVIERLLASPRFGENLAMFWLDYTGFGETWGFGSSNASMIDGSFKYKKKLIRALNHEPSYFRMLRDQLGRSTEVLARMPHDQWLRYQPQYEKDAVLGAISAMQTLYSYSLGMEMKCATCHNHVYSPITNSDFYSQLEPFVRPYDLGSLQNYRLRKDRRQAAPHFLPAFEATRADAGFWLSRRAGKKPADGPTLAELADWLTDTRDGVGLFSARVFVNALWSFFMGRGIVENESDWMALRTPPLHLDLLNHLTYGFIENGTSIKWLARSILTSRYYRSQVSLAGAALPDQLSLSRAAPVRPENIRDNLLQIAGKLRNGEPDFAEFKKGYPSLDPWQGKQPNFRYIYFARSRADLGSLAQHFPIPSGHKSVVRRPAEASFSEALFFLNPAHFTRMSGMLEAAFGRQLRANVAEGLDSLYLSFFSRHPSAEELESWRTFFGAAPITKQRLEMFFRILISTDEFTSNHGSGTAG